MSDDDKQTIFGFPVASIGFVDKERDAEIASLRAENTVLRDTMVKANELHEKTIAGSAENERAWTAALAEAERERDIAKRELAQANAKLKAVDAVREHVAVVSYWPWAIDEWLSRALCGEDPSTDWTKTS